MYQPPQFRSTDRALAARLMREHPFASLISNDDEGLPFVTHLPLHLEDREAAAASERPGFVLLGHCARANRGYRLATAESATELRGVRICAIRAWHASDRARTSNNGPQG